MAEFKAILEAATEDLEKAVKLEEIDAQNDPEEEPYRSQYAAREIYNNTLNSLPDGDNLMLTAVKAALAIRIGTNLCDTNERPEGEGSLLHGLALCREGLNNADTDDFLFISTLLLALNALGRLFSDRADNEQAILWLSEAERQYGIYKRSKSSRPADQPAPSSFSALFGLQGIKIGDDKEEQRFESVYTRTLYYMAQVYCKLPNEAATAARYCGATLSRQLESDEYDPLDWALNAGALSQFFITKSRFGMARYCLASADAMFNEQLLTHKKVKDEANNSLVTDNKDGGDAIENEQTPAKNEVSEEDDKIIQGRADMHRCWAKYGLSLLDPTSEPRDITEEEKSEEDKEVGLEDKIDMERLRFNKLKTISQYETITHNRPDSMETARPIFLFIQDHLNSAKEFYTLEYHCSDHIAVVQDHSRAFRLLADYYETDNERQCRMHKRRLDMLRPLIDEINPQHFLMIHRQLQFECGETFQSMVTIKSKYMEREKPTGETLKHSIKKINSLCREGISIYTKYIKSYQLPNGDMPAEFPLEEVRPVLLAHFHKGHLYSKILEADKGKRIKNIEESIRMYRFVVDYCNRVPKAKDSMLDELPLCEEMVQLLPGKIRKIALET